MSKLFLEKMGRCHQFVIYQIRPESCIKRLKNHCRISVHVQCISNLLLSDSATSLADQNLYWLYTCIPLRDLFSWHVCFGFY